MAAAYRIETAFMRTCSNKLAGEIGFSPEAELQMFAVPVFWPQVYQVLRTGRVIWSDKEEAEGAKSIMVGACCDGVRLRLTLLWSFAPAQILVASVERI
jgi:hypothetical protein